jgi:hypothetical protein
MKKHPIAAILEDKRLKLAEIAKCTWTGGLTTYVVYQLLNDADTVVAEAAFSFNRHPGTYIKQGVGAKAGTQRYAALDKLMVVALAL